MHSIHVGKGATICRTIILVVSLATIGSSTCLGDQLQWNALSACEEAVQAIGRESLLISYCSQANEDYIELWLVRGAYVIHTPAEGLFEVLVVAKRLYKSQKAFSSGEFPVSTDQWCFNEVRDSCQGSGRFPRSMVGYMSPPFSSDVLSLIISFSPVIEPPLSSLLCR